MPTKSPALPSVSLDFFVDLRVLRFVGFLTLRAADCRDVNPWDLLNVSSTLESIVPSRSSSSSIVSSQALYPAHRHLYQHTHVPFLSGAHVLATIAFRFCKADDDEDDDDDDDVDAGSDGGGGAAADDDEDDDDDDDVDAGSDGGGGAAVDDDDDDDGGDLDDVPDDDGGGGAAADDDDGDGGDLDDVPDDDVFFFPCEAFPPNTWPSFVWESFSMTGGHRKFDRFAPIAAFLSLNKHSSGVLWYMGIAFQNVHLPQYVPFVLLSLLIMSNVLYSVVVCPLICFILTIPPS